MRLLRPTAATSGTDETAQAATLARVASQVGPGLARWFGVYGAAVLLARALAAAQVTEPVLSDFSVSTTSPIALRGLEDSVRDAGVARTADGMVVLIAVLADVLHRLIGDGLATSLLEQSLGAPKTNGETAAHLPHPPTRQDR